MLLSIFNCLVLLSCDLSVYIKHLSCRPDVEELTKEYINLSVEDAAEAEVPLLFVSFPSAKDPSWSERFPGKFLCLSPYDSRGALCFLVCASVRSSICLLIRQSVHLLSPFKLKFWFKFMVKVVVDEVEVQSTWNLVHMFPMIWPF